MLSRVPLCWSSAINTTMGSVPTFFAHVQQSQLLCCQPFVSRLVMSSMYAEHLQNKLRIERWTLIPRSAAPE
jgi:hypothetical protein